MGSKKHDELAVFGFVNRTFKEPAFRDVRVLPIHLIEMAARWYNNEQVYLVNEIRHYRINVDDIVSS